MAVPAASGFTVTASFSSDVPVILIWAAASTFNPPTEPFCSTSTLLSPVTSTLPISPLFIIFTSPDSAAIVSVSTDAPSTESTDTLPQPFSKTTSTFFSATISTGAEAVILVFLACESIVMSAGWSPLTIKSACFLIVILASAFFATATVISAAFLLHIISPTILSEATLTITSVAVIETFFVSMPLLTVNLTPSPFIYNELSFPLSLKYSDLLRVIVLKVALLNALALGASITNFLFALFSITGIINFVFLLVLKTMVAALLFSIALTSCFFVLTTISPEAALTGKEPINIVRTIIKVNKCKSKPLLLLLHFFVNDFILTHPFCKYIYFLNSINKYII